MEKSIPQSLLPGTNMTHGHGLDYLLIKDASKFENKMRKLMRNVPPSKRINKYYPIKLSNPSKLVPRVSKTVIDLRSEQSSNLLTNAKKDVTKNLQKLQRESFIREKGQQTGKKVEQPRTVRKNLKTLKLRRRWTRAEDEHLAKAMSKNKFQKGKRPHEPWIAIEKEMHLMGQSNRKIKEMRERARHLNLDPRFLG